MLDWGNPPLFHEGTGPVVRPPAPADASREGHSPREGRLFTNLAASTWISIFAVLIGLDVCSMALPWPGWVRTLVPAAIGVAFVGMLVQGHILPRWRQRGA
jgi:hypothetical protein